MNANPSQQPGLSGVTTSTTRKHNFKDMTGRRFGRLVVIRLDRVHKRQAHWLTVCDCGRESVIGGPNLRRGRTTRCLTCSRQANRLDLTGQTFGSLTVIGYAGMQSQNRSGWICRCKCGMEITVTSDTLRERHDNGRDDLNACLPCRRAGVRQRAKEHRAAKIAATAARRAALAVTMTATCPLSTCGKTFTYTLMPGDTPRRHCCRQHTRRHIEAIIYGIRRAKRMGATIVGRPDPYNVLRRDGFVCQTCHLQCDPADYGKNKKTAPQVDHRVAFVNGGSHDEANMQTLCRRCHEIKSVEEFTPESETSNAKLTFAIAEKMRAEYKAGLSVTGKRVTHKGLGLKYGVSRKHVGGIIRGEYWSRGEVSEDQQIAA
jgi:5-methylcytosine-specific restriction endonuclease McrA